MRRREFLRLGFIALAGVAASCRGAGVAPVVRTTVVPPTRRVTPVPATPTRLPPSSTPTVVPTRPAPTPAPLILRNEDTPGFYVRYYQPFAAPDPVQWQLAVDGLVDAPTALTLADIQARLPFLEREARLKCVEGWSRRATWGGFTYAALAQLVRPQPAATHVTLHCADGYWEVLSLAGLDSTDALFATHMNGQPLPAPHGAPLRLVRPACYGYKSAKAITRLEFQREGGRGYWSTAGPYTVSGEILPGIDYPLDLDGVARQVGGGEITTF